MSDIFGGFDFGEFEKELLINRGKYATVQSRLKLEMKQLAKLAEKMQTLNLRILRTAAIAPDEYNDRDFFTAVRAAETVLAEMVDVGGIISGLSEQKDALKKLAWGE